MPGPPGGFRWPSCRIFSPTNTCFCSEQRGADHRPDITDSERRFLFDASARVREPQRAQLPGPPGPIARLHPKADDCKDENPFSLDAVGERVGKSRNNGPSYARFLWNVGPRRRSKRMCGKQRLRPKDGCEKDLVETDA